MKEDEKILVLPQTVAVSKPWTGIKKDGILGFETLVKNYGQFMPRSLAENDPSWKQVIPYMVFRYQDKYFLMQRTSAGGEARLHNKYSLGIGGHINENDIDRNSVLEWGEREFEEEVEYIGEYSAQPLGLIYDPKDLVGRVHLGYLILLEGSSPDIFIRETEKLTGKFASLDEVLTHFDHLESWSQFVVSFLQEQK